MLEWLTVSKADDRCCYCRKDAGEESGLHRAGCRLTAGGGDSQESATEIKPPIW